jgi:hypothetical protein
MRRLLLVLLAAASPAVGEIRSADDCAAAVAADPATAREDAAVWQRLGGGVPARLCEAEALAALGAHSSAAGLLTRLAENPNRAIEASLRAVILADAAVQWLAADRPDLARTALAGAERLAPLSPEGLLLRARAEAAEADWPAAAATLAALLEAEPDDARARALHAAALRRGGDPQAARVEAEAALALDPDLPEAMFEAAAASAETGDPERATALWLELVSRHPDHDLAAPARRNLQALDGT